MKVRFITIGVFLIQSLITNCGKNDVIQEISLDGVWQFAIDSMAAFDVKNVSEKAGWRQAEVPLSWQAQFADLRNYAGVAWYRREVNLSSPQPGKTILLKFNAVDYLARVYVNSREVGSHEGGYTPFEFDIGDHIRAGNNEILLRVMDPPDNQDGYEGIGYKHIPHGKQDWYVQNSGIWQSVGIAVRPERFIRQAHFTAMIDGHVNVGLLLAGKGRADHLSLRILDPDNKLVAELRQTLNPEQDSLNLSFDIENPSLWDVGQPNLYQADISLSNGDRFKDRFGFRAFESKEGKLYLNGRPVFIRAALDQDFYPETIYTTPSENYLRDQMQKALDLGLNMLRCHIKVPDPRYLKAADELGLLVWAEVPNWSVFSADAARRGSETMDAMLARDWNHPSLAILSIINESWGIDLQSADQREWLRQEFDRVKQKAAGRLVVDNSACWGNFHLKTDINDYHTYWAIPENRKNFTETVSEVAQRPDWLFSPFGDASQTGTEPLMISEFGNWGLPRLPAEKPFWFYKDFAGRDVTLPAGYEKRFKAYGYDKIFGTYDALADASQRAQFRALKWEIEEIRRFEAIRGYVITEFTDINWEVNGLLDMWRNKKIYAAELSDIQQPDLIIPRPGKYNLREGETLQIDLWLSHYSQVDLNGARLFWKAPGGLSGAINISGCAPGGVCRLPAVGFKIPQAKRAGKFKIEFNLKSATGKTLSVNYTEVFVFPTRDKIIATDVQLSSGLRKQRNLSGIIENSMSRESVLLTDRIDDQVKQVLQAGGEVICLATDENAFPSGFPLTWQSRSAEWYDGNWASNFNWHRFAHTPMSGLSFETGIGFEWAHCRPSAVLTGIDSTNFEDVLSGLFVGWLNLNSGYIVQMNAGRGRLIVCTLSLFENVQDDPYSESLLHALVSYISGDDCRPGLEWKFM